MPAVYAPWEDQPRPVQCAWWVLCDQEATSARPHPVLGDVPICDRCRAKVEALERR